MCIWLFNQNRALLVSTRNSVGLEILCFRLTGDGQMATWIEFVSRATADKPGNNWIFCLLKLFHFLVYFITTTKSAAAMLLGKKRMWVKVVINAIHAQNVANVQLMLYSYSLSTHSFMSSAGGQTISTVFTVHYWAHRRFLVWSCHAVSVTIQSDKPDTPGFILIRC